MIGVSPFPVAMPRALTPIQPQSPATQNPLAHAIRERTATADQADAQFEAHIKAFLAKKNAPTKDLAREDFAAKEALGVRRHAAVSHGVYPEPYYAASSSGLGTLGARANSADAGIAYCQKVKAQAQQQQGK